MTFAATGDPDLDGNLFHSFDHRAVSVGDISNTDNGSDTLTVTLSSIASIDSTLMNEIANTANWRGRTVRVWTQVYEPTGVTKQGAIVPFYTGYASSVKIMPAPDSQSIALEVENYLALFSSASNRSYLNQTYYDAADVSAAATLAAANMGHGVSTAGATGGGGGGDGSGRGTGFGGGYCVTTDTPILMADGSERSAGDLRVGDVVRTRHEETLAWGNFPVEAISFVEDDVLAAPGYPRATAMHRFWVDERWVRMHELGVPDGRSIVAKITVTDAHTYISAGILSHNMKNYGGGR